MNWTRVESKQCESGAARCWSILVVAFASLALFSAAAVVLANQSRSRTAREMASVQHAILAPVRTEDYKVRLRGDLITVSSPGIATSGNVRIAFWKTGAKTSLDQQSCVVWREPTGKSQPGIALRIDPGGPDRPARALVVTQNVWGDVNWTLNLLGMEVGVPPAKNAFGNVDVLETLRGPGHSVSTDPWHVCARVVGRKVSIKTWLDNQTEPAWTSKSGVWHLTVPADWVYSGYAGAYAAHLKPGASRKFEALTTTDLS